MLDFFGTIGGAIMAPLYYVISAVLVGFHKLFGSVFGPETGTRVGAVDHRADARDPRWR